MKTYNEKSIKWIQIRGKRCQLQKYVWDDLDKNYRFACLEVRPEVPVGLLYQIKLEVPMATDFDTFILNDGWDLQTKSFLDSTTELYYSTNQIASWSGSDKLLYDAAIGPVYFEAGYKTWKKELEALGRDCTTDPKPCLAIFVERNTGSHDSTKIEGEIIIEGPFAPEIPASFRAHPKK